MNGIEKTKRSDVLIILPAYNEGFVIREVLENIKAVGYTEICVVDDGSQDQTAHEASKTMVHLLRHPINRGAGAAVQTGLAYAKKKGYSYAVLIDSDGQHFPSDIDGLFQKMQQSKADIVIGNRFTKGQNEIPVSRVFYNRIADIFTNMFCTKIYSDTQSGFRVLNRKAIKSLKMKNRSFAFCSEMIIFAEKHGLRIEEHPIQVRYTEYSMQKGQNLWEGIRTARSIMWRFFFH